jgi:hypothetical protein
VQRMTRVVCQFSVDDAVPRHVSRSGQEVATAGCIPMPDETATDTWLEVRSILGSLVFEILKHNVFASTGHIDISSYQLTV